MSTVETESNVETTVAVQSGNIPGELFATVWNTSNTRQEALDTFHRMGYSLEYGSLGARVKSFRKAGVPMKEMPRASTTGRKGKKLDVSKLTAAVEAALAAKNVAPPSEGNKDEAPAS